MNLIKQLTTFAVIAFFSCNAYSQQTTTAPKVAEEVKEGLKAGDQAPNFKHKDINGKEVSLSDFAGKYVYLDVWASWCGPCKGEIPFLKEAEKKMHGKNIVFVSVSVDKDIEAWKKTVAEKEMSGIQLHNGGDRTISNAFVIPTIPRFILIGPDGKVVDPKMIRPSSGDALINYFNALPKI